MYHAHQNINGSELRSFDIAAGQYDTDFTRRLDPRRSTTGLVLFAANGPIAWSSKSRGTHQSRREADLSQGGGQQ
jgi:hypothetical protein